jgi:hypothetical protein
MFVKGARILGILCLLFVSAAVVSAHHSFAAEFDANSPVKLTGSVSRVEWLNPHAFVYVDVTDADGKKATWGCEMGSPNGLMRQGWTRQSLKIGDVVTIEGFRAKDNSNTANSRSVVLANGQRLFAGSSQTVTP